MLRVLFTVLMLLCLPMVVHAQDLQSLLQVHKDEIAKPKRKSVGPVLDALLPPVIPPCRNSARLAGERGLSAQSRRGCFSMCKRPVRRCRFWISRRGELSEDGVSEDAVKQIKPNGGVRKAIGKRWCSSNCLTLTRPAVMTR